MAKNLTPIENKLNRIDEISGKMIEGLMNEENADSLRDAIIEASEDEKLAMLVYVLHENNSNLSDITTLLSNYSIIDSPAFNDYYGRNLGKMQLIYTRDKLMEENKSGYAMLSEMGYEYSDVKDDKDYLSFTVEVEDDRGKKHTHSTYKDLRRYTESQATSNVEARTIYHMIMDHPDDLEVLLGDSTIYDSVSKVITAMHLPDLKKVCENGGVLSKMAEDLAPFNEEGEIFPHKLDGDVIGKLAREIKNNLNEDYEEDYIDEKVNGKDLSKEEIDIDDFGFEEVDDDEDTLE